MDAAAPQAPASTPAADAPAEKSGVTVSSTLEGAADELDRAERQIADVLGGAKKGDAGRDRASETELGAGGTCDVACRALASMQRAAEHLCELSGEDDERCSGARTRVRSATERVREACPACAG
jgi:hypothetical protein